MTGRDWQMIPYPLGAHYEMDCIRFSFASKKEHCGVILFDRNSGRRLKKLPFSQKERIGNIYCKYLEDVDPTQIAYQFYEEDHIIPDARARVFVGRHAYGREREDKDLKAGFLRRDFDWQGDVRPHIPYEESVCYCMHVRGFTKHASSEVADRGTFRGVIEKIPYLKECGITTVELQPVYEFMEVPSKEERRTKLPQSLVTPKELDQLVPRKLNYWGYKKGYYYMPKAAYAAGEDAATEFKEMVRAFHANGMEVVMQFYFPNDVQEREIPEILHFWLLEYHVDGFHLMGERIPTTVLAKDELLADTKLWYYYFDTDLIYERGEYPHFRNLASYQDDYMYTMRRYLKGDENMLQSVLHQMRHTYGKEANIHYLTNYYGLTLMDLVSYDRKHNEPNGEDNRDGNNFNCSWNCGEEGTSRRKKILKLRRKQIKNAMCMLLLGQATPLIFMGDEFGNSQKGNNNPYCQDNTVTWLDWRDIERNSEIHKFWKTLVKIRKEHPILRQQGAFRLMDYNSCGYPDLSYHGQNAWRPQLESYNRHVGVMYCGKYAQKEDGQEDDFFYLAMNMYWEPQKLGLPKLPKGLRWKQIICTDNVEDQGEGSFCDIPAGEEIQEDTEHRIPARTIELFMSVPVQPVGKTKRKRISSKKQ
ncbi:MAG: hypothetical protein J1E64_00755 [Acetatifactor sp.]|nr:hypothetical protein [Acetatifactor sp.]